MAYQVDAYVRDVDKAMRQLREAMKGIQIRRAGFKKHHDDLTRAVGHYTVGLVEGKALMSKSGNNRRRHR